MRKVHLLFPVAVLVLSFTNAKAQNTSPYWSLAGNSNATTSSKLGTTNGIPLRILTKNIERIRIDTAGRVGIGTSAPTARLMVNTPSNTNPLVIQIGGSSKLFMHANAGLAVGASSTPPATGLYVKGRVGIGTNTPSQKLHVVGNGYFTDSVGIGTAKPRYKLHVEGGSGVGIYSYSSANYAIYASSGYLGVYGYGSSYGMYGSGGTYGVYGNGSSYGVYGYGSYGVYGNGTNYGVYGSSSGNGVWGAGYNGVYGNSPSANGTWGNTATGYGAVGNATSSGIGGYFQSATGIGVVGRTSNSAGQWAGAFYGNVYSSGAYQTSDKRLKKNIAEFTDAMDIINQLKPRTYEFQTEGKMAELNLPQGKHYGLIAQDVEAVLPNLVKEVVENPTAPKENAPSPAANTTITVVPQDPTKKIVAPTQAHETPTNSAVPKKGEEQMIKVVNYTELIPILIKGMQEQEAAIKAKDERITALEERLSKLEAIVTGNTAITANTTGYLEQNTPNPVNGNTSIRYHIPETATAARLDVTNTKGQLVKTVNLNNRGLGQVKLNTSSLAAGAYNYTLYVDGKQMDSRRLVIVH